MPKFDIYVKVSILINYKTKQPSNLAWNISLTSWLCDIGIPFSIRLTVHLNIYVEVRHFRQSECSNQLQFYNNHHTLHDMKLSAEDTAVRGNGTGLEYMCPTRHFVYIFFNPVFQLSTAKNEINLFNNHVLIVAPVTFAPAGATTPSAEFLLWMFGL